MESEQMSVEEFRAAIKDLETRAAVETRCLRSIVATAEARGVARRDGAPSMVEWVAWRLNTSLIRAIDLVYGPPLMDYHLHGINRGLIRPPFLSHAVDTLTP